MLFKKCEKIGMAIKRTILSMGLVPRMDVAGEMCTY